MGGVLTCQRSDTCDGGCSSRYECLQCTYFDDKGGVTDTHCRSTVHSLGVHVVLPVVLCLLFAVAAAMAWRWWSLRRMRRSLPEYTPMLAATHGGYAAGKREYSFASDAFPFLLPVALRRVWLTDVIWVQLLLLAGFVCAFLAPIFLWLGGPTNELGRHYVLSQFSNERNNWFQNSGRLLAASLALSLFATAICTVACMARACVPAWRRERFERERVHFISPLWQQHHQQQQYQQHQQYHAPVPTMPPVAAPVFAGNGAPRADGFAPLVSSQQGNM